MGFNIRLTDPRQADAAWVALLPGLYRPTILPAEPFEAFADVQSSAQSPLRSLLGEPVAPLLLKGIRALLGPIVHATIYGPALEGILYYPNVNAELRLSPLPIWIAGDAGGTFRGLTAAIVSGYFTGLRAGAHVGGAR